jgi:nucleoside 2-deoxyribosyltransferase
MTPKLVYIAGPYRAANAWLCEQNIREAEAVAYRVAQLGAYPVCPHTNTRQHFESAQDDPQFWLGGTLELMRRCDGVFLVRGWPDSSGTLVEIAEAERLGKPVFYAGDFDKLGEWLRGGDAP